MGWVVAGIAACEETGQSSSYLQAESDFLICSPSAGGYSGKRPHENDLTSLFCSSFPLKQR